MNKCVIILVEGDTEVEFYKHVIAYVKNLRPHRRFDTYIEIRNVKGVGGFKKDALRIFVEIKRRYEKDCKFTIVLCSDTDVFEFASKPPIKWNEVKKELQKNGASEIIHVQARRSIEDWFLCDTAGVLSFLRLDHQTKISGKGGYEKLKYLYKKANKTYNKGRGSKGMIEHLDIEKIIREIKDELETLYEALGVGH